MKFVPTSVFVIVLCIFRVVPLNILLIVVVAGEVDVLIVSSLCERASLPIIFEIVTKFRKKRKYILNLRVILVSKPNWQ